jgi:hypothetical protein
VSVLFALGSFLLDLVVGGVCGVGVVGVVGVGVGVVVVVGVVGVCVLVLLLLLQHQDTNTNHANNYNHTNTNTNNTNNTNTTNTTNNKVQQKTAKCKQNRHFEGVSFRALPSLMKPVIYPSRQGPTSEKQNLCNHNDSFTSKSQT